MLDTRDLSIDGVEAIDAGGAAHAVPFSLARRDPILGSALSVRFDAPAQFRALQRRGYAERFLWDASATEYINRMYAV